MPDDAQNRPPTAPPGDFRGLRDFILDRRTGLPRRLAQVADFALAAPDAMAFGTAARIAEEAGVQPSTLVRFAQTLGYGGFSDLQAVFRQRLLERSPTYGDRLEALLSHTGPEAGTEALITGFLDAARQSVTKIGETLTPDLVEAVVSRLSRAETIYLIGQRRSFPVVAGMAYAFGKLGVRTVLVGSGIGIDTETIGFATPADAAIAVSFAPYASTTLAQAQSLKERHVPLVAITDTPFSPLALDAEAWIEVNETDFEGFRSLSATMAVAMIITVAVAKARRAL